MFRCNQTASGMHRVVGLLLAAYINKSAKVVFEAIYHETTKPIKFWIFKIKTQGYRLGIIKNLEDLDGFPF